MLGAAQILAWGSSYYLPAVLARPIADDTGWPLAFVVGGLSLGRLVSGLASPRLGRAIERRGGRPVLVAGAVLFAAGLAGVALSTHEVLYLAAWSILGLGMGAGLYDAVFATLGRMYGESARQAITSVTLWGGLASTVCWPLSAFLVETVGWRGACLVYAALHLGVLLPLYVLFLPREEERRPEPARGPSQGAVDSAIRTPAARTRLTFALLAAALTLSAAVSSVMSVHLITILQARDLALGAAVALGALVGPCQVGARAIELVIGRHYHPIWTMFGSAALMAAGFGVLWGGFGIVAVALVLYGAGLGIRSVAQGTLPLALYGHVGYATLMGRLAMPSLLAQSAAPLAGAFMLDAFGASATLAALTGAALLNVGLVAALWWHACAARPHARRHRI